MTSRERIGTAQYSDDLSEVAVDEIGDVDIIRACGMAAQSNPLGLRLWRWRVGGDRREMPRVAEALAELGWPVGVVFRVVAHLDDDLCPGCLGRGYELMPGAPVLSDALCPSCRGSGRRELQGEQEKELLEFIAKLQQEVAAAIMRRLSRQLDL